MAYARMKKIISPKAVLDSWPKLTLPDEYLGLKSYKASLILDPKDEGVQDFLNVLNEEATASYESALAVIGEELATATGKKLNTLKERELGLKKHVPISDEFLEDGSTSGRVIVKMKRKAEGTYVSGKNAGTPWKASVPIFDANKNPVLESAGIIQGGSVVRIQTEIIPFYMNATATAGISLRIFAVQVLEMEGASVADEGFDVEEGGYVTPATKPEDDIGHVSADSADDSEDF